MRLLKHAVSQLFFFQVLRVIVAAEDDPIWPQQILQNKNLQNFISLRDITQEDIIDLQSINPEELRILKSNILDSIRKDRVKGGDVISPRQKLYQPQMVSPNVLNFESFNGKTSPKFHRKTGTRLENKRKRFNELFTLDSIPQSNKIRKNSNTLLSNVNYPQNLESSIFRAPKLAPPATMTKDLKDSWNSMSRRRQVLDKISYNQNNRKSLESSKNHAETFENFKQKNINSRSNLIAAHNTSTNNKMYLNLQRDNDIQNIQMYPGIKIDSPKTLKNSKNAILQPQGMVTHSRGNGKHLKSRQSVGTNQGNLETRLGGYLPVTFQTSETFQTVTIAAHHSQPNNTYLKSQQYNGIDKILKYPEAKTESLEPSQIFDNSTEFITTDRITDSKNQFLTNVMGNKSTKPTKKPEEEYSNLINSGIRDSTSKNELFYVTEHNSLEVTDEEMNVTKQEEYNTEEHGLRIFTEKENTRGDLVERLNTSAVYKAVPKRDIEPGKEYHTNDVIQMDIFGDIIPKHSIAFRNKKEIKNTNINGGKESFESWKTVDLVLAGFAFLTAFVLFTLCISFQIDRKRRTVSKVEELDEDAGILQRIGEAAGMVAAFYRFLPLLKRRSNKKRTQSDIIRTKDSITDHRKRRERRPTQSVRPGRKSFSNTLISREFERSVQYEAVPSNESAGFQFPPEFERSVSYEAVPSYESTGFQFSPGPHTRPDSAMAAKGSTSFETTCSTENNDEYSSQETVTYHTSNISSSRGTDDDSVTREDRSIPLLSYTNSFDMKGRLASRERKNAIVEHVAYSCINSSDLPSLPTISSDTNDAHATIDNYIPSSSDLSF